MTTQLLLGGKRGGGINRICQRKISGNLRLPDVFIHKDRDGYQVGAKSHSSLGNSCLYGLASIHKPTHRDMAARG